MKQAQTPKHSERSARVYDRLLHRVKDRVEELELKSWDAIQDEIERAVEFEVDVADLTREELELFKAYLRRDLKSLRQYMAETGKGVADWLSFDLDYLEEQLGHALKSIADKTRVDLTDLEQKLSHDESVYLAGEIATAGTLRCVNCGKIICLTRNTVLESCHRCEERIFTRVTGRWPGAEDSEQTDSAS